MEKIQFCSEHREEKKLFCLQCKLFSCNTCALFGDHKDHDVHDIEKAQQILK